MSYKQTSFDYHTAFSRNLGWVTEWEQASLRSKRIAIAGMGGVGGSHLLTLTRLGIGAFNIADFDIFEQANFNRQAGACLNHVGQPKVDVMAKLALDINPELMIRKFPGGVHNINIETFLKDVDLYIDGLDFFALESRRLVFAVCAKKGIPAITAAPLGMGVALLNFLPQQMTFENYFRLEDHPEKEQLLRFILGLSPALLQVSYLADNSRVDLERRKVPSTPMACELCAGVAATYALKILLNRGKVPAAPHGIQFDAYRNKLVHTWRPLGNNHPLQRLGLYVMRKRLFKKLKANNRQSIDEGPKNTSVEKILDLARWAPSGDNLQPWRFEIVGDDCFSICSNVKNHTNVYDLNGWATQLSLGALLENISIAASAEGMRADFRPHSNGSMGNLRIDVCLFPMTVTTRSPLLPFIKARTTERRSMASQPLGHANRQMLEDSIRPYFRVLWFDQPRMKWKLGRLIYQNAHIRLKIPETYAVHKKIIEWQARFSHDRIPDQAIGLDSLTVRMMQWVMKSWKRVKLTNRFLGGTTLTRIQLDLLPSLNCAAHFFFVALKVPQSVGDYLDAGRAIQRFWLTATKLGLQLQPQLTPLMFAYYVRENITFTQENWAQAKAKRLAEDLKNILGPEIIRHAVFMGRVGFGKTPISRSLRKPLSELCVSQNEKFADRNAGILT